MAQIRFKGFQTGTAVDLSNVTAGASAGSVSVPAFQAPAAITGLPRISSGQAAGDTLTLDTTGLTGITGYAWREAGGAVLGTGASFDSSAHSGTWIECAVTCDQGTLTSPAVQVYMQMAMASHNTDDAALLALVPHDDITHLAIADGNWTDGATWSGGAVPGPGARVLIPHGRSVTYDASERCRLDWVRIDGTLTWSLTQSTVIFAEHLIITRGGALICGTSTGRLPAQHRAEFISSGRHYRDNSYFATDMNLARDTRLIGRGIVSQGRRIMWGAAKTSWLRTANGSAPMAEDTTLTLSAVPVGWEVGNTIVIGGTSGSATSQTEERIITGISGAVVSWTGGLTYDHDKQNNNATRTDLQPGIANLTRNIVIRSEDAGASNWQRGHTMDMHMFAVMDIWDVEHADLGRTVKSVGPERSGVIDAGQFKKWNNSNAYITETLTGQSNVQSRYPVHSHHAGFMKAQTDTASNCTVRGTPGWGIVHHAGKMNINRCAVYEFTGAGIVSESGNETGEWLENITVKSLNKDNRTPKNAGSDYGVVDVTGDFFRSGYGMAMRSRALRNSRNMTMDDSSGYVFYHRQSGTSIAPNIRLKLDDIDLKDLQGPVGVYGISGPDYPLVHTNNNESAGAYGLGMFVTKSGPAQDHGMAVVIQNFSAWGFHKVGQEVEYINQYVLSDTDCLPSGNAGSAVGIAVGGQAWEVAVLRPKTEACALGVYFNGSVTAGLVDTSFNSTNNPRFMLVAHNSTNDAAIYRDDGDSLNGNGTKVRVWTSEPSYSVPSTDLPFKLAEWDGNTRFNSGISNVVSGYTLTDSVSSGLSPVPKYVDQLGTPRNSPASKNFGSYALGFAAANGYWMVGGQPYIIFALYLSDRLTGNWIKQYHGIELTGSVGPYVNNGTYILKPNAMSISGNQFVSVTTGQSRTVDVVSLVMDIDQDVLSLSPNHISSDHGRIEVNGDEITYTPDDGYTGPDKAQFAVEDGKGNAIRVDLNFTVS